MMIEDILFAILVITCFVVLIRCCTFLVKQLFQTNNIPTISLFAKHKKIIQENISISKDTRILDLGCGTGAALRFFATTYGCIQLSGVDLNRAALRYGRRKNYFAGCAYIDLMYQDIFTTDISEVDYIYIFLMPSIMSRVEERLEEHLSPETIVIINAFPLPHRTPYASYTDEHDIPKIFLYKRSKT